MILQLFTFQFLMLWPIFNAINSLLRLCNKQICLRDRKTYLSFSLILLKRKSWDCLEIEIDQRVWARIFILYWFQICSVTSVILCIFWKKLSVRCWEVLCVLEGIKISILSVVVLDQRKCVSWGDQGHFFGCVVSDLGLIA